MMPKDGRCEEHGLYLYREGFGWSCKLGCYYCDDPEEVKNGFVTQYKNKVKEIIMKLKKSDTRFKDNQVYNQAIDDVLEAIK